MTRTDTNLPNGQGSAQFAVRCLAVGVRRGEPLSVGLPIPRGILTPGRALIVRHANRTARTQLRVLDRWPDGSARWVLADWLADEGHAMVEVVENHVAASSAVGPAVAIRHDPAGVTVETGRLRFVIDRGSPWPLRVESDGQRLLDAGDSRLALEDDRGAVYQPRTSGIDVIDEGPVRACLVLHGTMVSPKSRSAAQFEWEMHFFAGVPVVRSRLTILNPRPSAHPGGMWDLGATGSIYLRDLSLRLALPQSMPAAAFCSTEIGQPLRPVAVPLELYQDSSGGENWQSHCHVNRQGRVPLQFRGYHLHQGGEETAGLRATPVVQLKAGPVELACTMDRFWQNFPKAVEADERSLSLRLWPRQHGDLHELQGGEQKTHEFVLSFGPDAVSETPLDWARDPMQCVFDPAWVCGTGAVSYLTPRGEDPNTHYLALVDQAVESDDTFIKKRERIDEYGWRHFGDIYADHEAVNHKGPGELVSHYNNQYDGVWGMGIQFLRSGDVRWFHQMRDLAQHVMDIDIYHTDGDKSAYNHGMFWHTCHYVDAGRSTHRSYSADVKVPGGGPSGGHLYTSGLMLYYFLTGDRLARQAVLELGRFAIDSDDGAMTIFRWLSGRPTGHPTASAPGFFGPGRASGNSVNALLDAWRLRGEQRFLHQAELYIRRCIHPDHDIESMGLLNPEARWFYTMFLQSLGKYLDAKAELGELDTMYAYAQASLLRYARWMAEHEYPYLDKPEVLEYPNETWAAQDMRKSEVFTFAAKHASGTERARFLERSDFFFNHSVNTLSTMSTRTLARPVVLLMANGLMHPYMQKHPDEAAPSPTAARTDFGRPTVFVPQKTRAVRRFKILMATGVLAAIAAVVAYVLRWG